MNWVYLLAKNTNENLELSTHKPIREQGPDGK